MRRWTPAAFEAQAMRVHDGKYCYPGLRFVHSSKKIDINCPKHGGTNLVGVRGLDTVKGLNSATNVDKATRDF
jgi:hypothetical protein